jgi:hypothetical protein
MRFTQKGDAVWSVSAYLAFEIFINPGNMKYKESDTVILTRGFYDEHDRIYIPQNTEGQVVNVMPVLQSYQIDFTGYTIVLVPEEIISAKVAVSHDKQPAAEAKRKK